ncbi:MAG: hypothetical protein KFW21_02295 [Spirochaetota bacterium]|nr:hypothetical protein [Spirochaetota bacterium]
MREMLSLDQLEFDHENYRYGVLEHKDQEFIYEYFVQYSAGFKKLQKAMSTYIMQDISFLVCPSSNEGKYIVLDGNTRLSTLLYMQRDKHPFIIEDFTISCIVFKDKISANLDIIEKHTQSNFTPWTLIAQARINMKAGKSSDQDLLISKIYDHLKQIAIDSSFRYNQIEYNITNCMETEQGDIFTNFYLRSYSIFKTLKIDFVNIDQLNDLQTTLLNQLMLQFCNNKLNSSSADRNYKTIIKKIYDGLSQIEETLISTNNLFKDHSQDSINQMIAEISSNKKSIKKINTSESVIGTENNIVESNESIQDNNIMDNEGEKSGVENRLFETHLQVHNISILDESETQVSRNSSKHANYKKPVSEQIFCNKINEWLEIHGKKCSKNISFRVLRELSDIKPEKRNFATAFLLRALGDSLVFEKDGNDKGLTSYAHKNIQNRNDKIGYSLIIKEYDKLSKYAHGLSNCNSQDIYTIFNHLYECYNELINNLNK